VPKTEEDWLVIANDFEKKWNVPNCVGAMDGKHISVQAPIGSGSDYFNYKKFFSIVLFAVVDANYNFLYVNVGSQGRISDGGVFNQTSFKRLLDDCKLNLPTDCVLPGREMPIPYVFLADDAFPLTSNIMKPYAGTQEKGSKTRICNYRFSRGRRIAENVFGIMSNVFRFLRRQLLMQPETAELITLAAVYLHNFMRRNSSRYTYTPPGTFDVECPDTGEIKPGDWRNDHETRLEDFPRIARKSVIKAAQVRDEFREYFCSKQGEIAWQYHYC